MITITALTILRDDLHSTTLSLRCSTREILTQPTVTAVAVIVEGGVKAKEVPLPSTRQSLALAPLRLRAQTLSLRPRVCSSVGSAWICATKTANKRVEKKECIVATREQ